MNAKLLGGMPPEIPLIRQAGDTMEGSGHGRADQNSLES
jgi:hypothetical protein